MFKKNRIISIIVCIAMFCCSIISPNAIETSEKFIGYITSDEQINLSDIEIKVYSALPIYDDSNNLLFFEEYYKFSVYTDIHGRFAFEKPSEYCSYSVNLTSLPIQYGVSKHTQFIVPEMNLDEIMAAPIATAEVNIVEGNITATFADSNNNPLYTSYEIVFNEDKAVASDGLSKTIEEKDRNISSNENDNI